MAQMEYDKTNGITIHDDKDMLDNIGLTISKKGWLSCYCNNLVNYEQEVDQKMCELVKVSWNSWMLPTLSVFVSAQIRNILVILTIFFVP